jgi:hypothetical protein
MLLVELGSGKIIRFVRRQRDILWHVSRDARIQDFVGEEPFEGHVRIGRGDGSAAASEVKIDAEGHEHETKQQSENEFHGLNLPF